VIRDSDTPTRYRPLDSTRGKSRPQILRTLARLEWPSSRELMDAMEAPDDGHDTVRNKLARMLSRLVLDGLVEVRGPMGGREYELTAEGRAAARQRSAA
jgi:DNA-binding HxlR family transcriptional regulator